MNTRSAPINAWFWFAENSVKFKVVIGAKNGELSKLAAVADINNTPATLALFLYEFILTPFLSRALLLEKLERSHMLLISSESRTGFKLASVLTKELLVFIGRLVMFPLHDRSWLR